MAINEAWAKYRWEVSHSETLPDGNKLYWPDPAGSPPHPIANLYVTNNLGEKKLVRQVTYRIYEDKNIK